MSEKLNDRRAKKPNLYWQQNDRRMEADELYSPFKPRHTPFHMEVPVLKSATTDPVKPKKPVT